MSKLIIRLLLFLMVMPTALQAQKTIHFPNGSFRDTQSQDFVAKNLPSKYYNELWTYHINLDNGMQVLYTFSINDFGNWKERITGAKLMINWKNGENYIVNKQYKPEQMISRADSTYLRLHKDRPYWAKGSFKEEHELNFETTKDGISYFLNLTFYDIAQGKSVGDGKYKIGDNEIGISLLMPHAKVKGSISINGETVNVTGVGYMDHVYQNNLSSEIVDRSYRVKTGDDQNGMYLHFIRLKGSNSTIPIGYGVAYENGREYMITPSNIDRLQTAGYLDTEVRFKPYQMDAFKVDVKNKMETYSMLSELGSIQRFLAKRVIGGELIEIYGSALINEKKPAFFYYLVAK